MLLLEAVRGIDRAALPASALLDYDLFRRDVEEDVRAQEFPEELLAISQLSGPQYLSQVFEVMPTRTERDWADVLGAAEWNPARAWRRPRRSCAQAFRAAWCSRRLCSATCPPSSRRRLPRTRSRRRS